MQQQPSTIYYHHQFNQDAGAQVWPPSDNPKTHHYQQNHHWDSSAFVTSGGNYGPGQAGGGQNRQVGPPQSQTPSQPPPTSTPPGIHGDMSKPAVMQNQQGQLSYVQQTRPMNQPAFAQFQRTAMQPQQIRANSRTHIVAANYANMSGIQGVIQAPAPTAIMQAYPQLVYGPQRQGTPYPGQGQYIVQHNPAFYNAAPYYQQVMQTAYQGPIQSAGGPSPQSGPQPPQQPMMRPTLQAAAPALLPTTKQETKKPRAHALKIIDPITNEEVLLDESGGNNNNVTPTRSNDSSARETPQLSAGVSMDDRAVVVAEFAAQVAVLALEDTPPTLPPSDPADSAPSDSDASHKQPFVVPSSEKISKDLSITSQEFVPKSYQTAAMLQCNSQLTEEPQEFVPKSHQTAVIMQCNSQPVVESRTATVPTVSAETDSPAIEIPRPKEPKESFPALKNTTVPSGPASQSPIKVISKKQQKSSENERQQAATIPATQPLPVDNKESLTNNKNRNKGGAPKDEPAPQPRREKTRSKEQSPVPVSPVVGSEITSTIAEVTSVVVDKQALYAAAATLAKDAAKTVEEPPPPAPPLTGSKAAQHQNGETPVPEPPPAVNLDGNKNRGKNKKGGSKRDLNRKGVDKEGSDMDAFVTRDSATIVSEERERSTPPATSPPTIMQPPVTSAPPAVEAESPVSPVDKIKEDLVEKEDRLVAAKNEENAKVSALNKVEDEPDPVIEKPVPQLTLRHSYKNDQWSPLNPEGKKKYDREFLMQLKAEPQSSLKPENLPDVVASLPGANMGRSHNTNFNFMGNRDTSTILPVFAQRNSQSQRGPMMGGKGGSRGSQQGMKSGGGGGGGGGKVMKVIHMSLSSGDVKLKTSDNAWKPRGMVAPTTDKTGQETEDLYKLVRGILNKLTPQKFDTLMKKFMALPINSEERLIGVINLIFDKAVDEPSFSKCYANMCKGCGKHEVAKIENGQEQKVNFRKILITRCQTEFEKGKSAELDTAKHQEEIRNCTDLEKKKELQLMYEEKERMLRMKSVGNIRFIGELFKLGMLTPAIMYRCIEHLLNTPEEESLECLCKLLTTIGKELETSSQNTKAQPTASLNPYFQRMSELAQKKDSSKVSSRVRFMLQDVIELRLHKWVPRREDNNPKTIEQINREAERESMEMTLNLNQQPMRMNRGNDRSDDRNRGKRNNMGDDGWATVGGGGRHYNKQFNTAFESSKMQVKTDLDVTSLSLGGSSMYRFTPAKTMEAKPAAAPFTSSNLYSALRASEDRKPPQPSMNNRRGVTPTPSMEKERQRMIQGVEGEGRNSRGSSVQRVQPPSRESSVPRQPLDNRESSEPKERDDNEDKYAREERLERQTNTIFDEYLGRLSTAQDVKREIENMYPGDKVGDFVLKALQISLEKKAGAQKVIGQLITDLMDDNLFTPEVFVEQLGLIYDDADDIAIDVPKVWELQAQVLVPIVAAEKITFSHFKNACSNLLQNSRRIVTVPKLLLPLLKLVVGEKGEGFVRKIWDSSNVSLKDFLPPDVNVDAFIKENSLEYLTGEPPKCQILMDQVQDKLLRLMQTNEPYEKILAYISSNVGDNVEDLQFIRALITAICEACLESKLQGLDHAKFKEYKKLIQRFVDNKEDRELACLNSVHALALRLEHPQGLIMNIFNLFSEDGLISSDSFIKWRDDDEKLEQKGVSVLSLKSFFKALEESETDDENS